MTAPCPRGDTDSAVHTHLEHGTGLFLGPDLRRGCRFDHVAHGLHRLGRRLPPCAGLFGQHRGDVRGQAGIDRHDLLRRHVAEGCDLVRLLVPLGHDLRDLVVVLGFRHLHRDIGFGILHLDVELLQPGKVVRLLLLNRRGDLQFGEGARLAHRVGLLLLDHRDIGIDLAATLLDLGKVHIVLGRGDLVLEGGSIAVNGEGTLVTNEQCLLDPTRNPGLDRESIGAELKSRLGVSELVWLEQGLVEDGDTDGHVDNICAFIDPGKVLLQSAPEGDPNFENAQRNLQLLTDAGIEVVELDLLPRIERDGEPIVVPYTNFYIANGALIVPVSGVDPDMDAQALELLGRLYPDREAIGIDGRTLALGGGGIHCITQQIPAA